MLRLASRRMLLVEAAEQLSWAVGVVLTGFILILLFGTALLGWGWMVLLSAAGLTIAVLRLRRRLISRYRVAQLLDRKLSLSDALSTAHFLLSTPSTDHRPAAQFQLEQANRVAATVRVEEAFPFKAKRAWAICGALAAVSFGLFALRYLVVQSLNLRPPLVVLQMPPAIERLEEALGPKRDHVKTPPLPRFYPANPTADSTEAKDNGSLPTETSEPAGASDRNGDLTKAQTRTAGKGNQQASDAKPETRTGSQKSSQADGTEKTEERNGPQTEAQNATPGKEQSPNGSNTSSGLMNRMKDALSNMMAKMRANGAPQQPGQQRSEQSQSEAKNNQSASATPKAGEQSNGENARNEQSSEDQNGEGQAQGQTSERPQNSQGSSNQSAQKGSDAQSGVGRQDGDKGIKNAEQLQAMGKLAEIIGKRSANLTGDMTIETPSGKQQLKTAYSHQTGQHTDSGGEIHHNEIPMVYQQYVREYMEQVRKQQEKGKP